MAYIKTTITAGKTIEVSKTYSARYGVKGIKRSENINPTPEKVKKINQRNAEKRLRRLINTNFGEGDIHLVLTYKKEERPDVEGAHKELKNFIKRIKRVYEKEGLELKYIAVTEYEGKAIHHHMIIPGIDMRLIQKKWPHGKTRPTFMDDTGEYSLLAEYLIKETSKTFLEDGAAMKRRYIGSRNLVEPTVKKEIIKAQKFNNDPKPVKGYYVDKNSIVNGIHEITGWPYQFYRMIKIERRKR